MAKSTPIPITNRTCPIHNPKLVVKPLDYPLKDCFLVIFCQLIFVGMVLLQIDILSTPGFFEDVFCQYKNLTGKSLD